MSFFSMTFITPLMLTVSLPVSMQYSDLGGVGGVLSFFFLAYTGTAMEAMAAAKSIFIVCFINDVIIIIV